MDATAKAKADPLPHNAVELIAKAICCGAKEGCCVKDDVNACIAEEYYGKDAVAAVSVLRKAMRENAG